MSEAKKAEVNYLSRWGRIKKMEKSLVVTNLAYPLIKKITTTTDKWAAVVITTIFPSINYGNHVPEGEHIPVIAQKLIDG